MANEVVAHYLDGRLIKGTCLDIDPARPTCHVKTAEKGMVQVMLAQLKALFFVRSLGGDPSYHEVQALDSSDVRARGAALIELQFADGERVVGLTTRFPPVRRFFYVLPADVRSNNIRMLVNRSAVQNLGQPEVAMG
ncbi:MAG TPA: hypothetical protein VE091_02305 [Gemmatimonadales bacterium]|nr:hypothetical protein [Gemmatimonadales bacterium]